MKMYVCWRGFVFFTSMLTSIFCKTKCAMSSLSSSALSPISFIAQSLTSIMCSESSLATTASREQMSSPPNISETLNVEELRFKYNLVFSLSIFYVVILINPPIKNIMFRFSFDDFPSNEQKICKYQI